MTEHDEDMLSDINKALNESVQNLDGEIRSKLSQTRYHALEQNEIENHSILFSVWAIPLGSIAVAAVLALVWFINPGMEISEKNSLVNERSHQAVNGGDLSDESLFNEDLFSEKLFSEEYWQEDPDLMEELEFVAWLIEDEEFLNVEPSSAGGVSGNQFAG
ncbi:MAG: hypothetical protein JKY24_00400 [Pseudomonadales bacterium]|nr:hypothetical protein [Pseudomonadales bacterium]